MREFGHYGFFSISCWWLGIINIKNMSAHRQMWCIIMKTRNMKADAVNRCCASRERLCWICGDGSDSRAAEIFSWIDWNTLRLSVFSKAFLTLAGCMCSHSVDLAHSWPTTCQGFNRLFFIQSNVLPLNQGFAIKLLNLSPDLFFSCWRSLRY